MDIPAKDDASSQEQEPDSASSHAPESDASRQEPESDAARLESESAAPRQDSESAAPRQESESAAPRQEPGSAAPRLEPESDAAPRLEPESVAARLEPESTVRLEPESAAPRQEPAETASAEEGNATNDNLGSLSAAHGAICSGGASDDEAIQKHMADILARLQNIRAPIPVNHSDSMAIGLSSLCVQESEKFGAAAERKRSPQSGPRKGNPAHTTSRGADLATHKTSRGVDLATQLIEMCEALNETGANRRSPVKRTQPTGGARPKETRANGRRPEDVPVNGGAPPKETRANGRRPEDVPVNGGARPPDHKPDLQWHGHRNDLLEREQDDSVLHLVLPSPCLNNHTVHLGYLNRGNPLDRVEPRSQFVEFDNGLPVFRCEEEEAEEGGCSCSCDMLDDVGLPVVAMSFDSFSAAYHVETDRCRECDGGVGLARASVTGRARLIYEQMNSAHPQQTAFRIWEHERGAHVLTARCQPPPTNTLITVEKVHARDLQPQEYEHLFSVLLELRGIQSLFAFTSAYWGRTSFARQPETRRQDIETHVAKVTALLEEVGMLVEGGDHKLHGTVPPRCRPGKDLASSEAEAWLSRVERNCVEMQYLEYHDNQINILHSHTDNVKNMESILWGTMLTMNESRAERYYLDMPFASEEVPEEERLVTEASLLKPGSFRQTFLEELRAASRQEPMKIGPNYSWNGVLYTSKLRRKPEQYVHDLKRPVTPEDLPQDLVDARHSPAGTVPTDSKGSIALHHSEECVEADHKDRELEPAGNGEKLSGIRSEAEEQGIIRKEDEHSYPTLDKKCVEVPGIKKEQKCSSDDQGPCVPASENQDMTTIAEKGHSLDSLDGNYQFSQSNTGSEVPRAETLSDSPSISPELYLNTVSEVSEGAQKSRAEAQSDSSSVSPELSDTSLPHLSLELPGMKPEESMSNKVRTRIARDPSKDSGFLYSSGSGTDSRDASTTRSGSLDGGSAHGGSAHDGSAHGGSLDGGSASTGSERASPTDQELSKDVDMPECYAQHSEPSWMSYSDSKTPETTSSNDGAINGSEKAAGRSVDSTLKAETVAEFDERSILSYQGEEDSLFQDDGNASDASTIKGSTSTLTKGSRRRSSGEISGGSDFDERGAVIPKTLSPSKSPGRLLSKDGTIHGERLSAHVIPEEQVINDEEKETEVKQVNCEIHKESSSKTTLDDNKGAAKVPPGVVLLSKTKAPQGETLKPGTDAPKEECSDSFSYEEPSRLSKTTKTCAHLKNGGVKITEEERRAYIRDYDSLCIKITGYSYRSSFVRIDDGKVVDSEMLRKLSAVDFMKQSNDALTYQYLLNVSSSRNVVSNGHETKPDWNAKASPDADHSREKIQAANVQEATEDSEKTVTGEKREISSTADTSASVGLASTGSRGEVGRRLSKSSLSGRAFKRSPLRFLTNLESLTSPSQDTRSSEDERSAPPVVDNAERPAPPVVDIAERPAPTAVDIAERPAPPVVDIAEHPAPPVVDIAESPAPTAVDIAERPAPPVVDIAERPFGLSSISARQLEEHTMQAQYICSRIMQRNFPLNCLCNTIVGDAQLQQLATKLEDMLTKGRILQFLERQRQLLDHVCKGSVMEYVTKASSSAETDNNVLNDLMLILELHYDPDATPHTYCKETPTIGCKGGHKKHSDQEKRPDKAAGERFAKLSSKQAALYLARHHLWRMRQSDFLDPAPDDPLTRMTLHEHYFGEPEKAARLTPFQLFLEWYLNPFALQELCDKLNEYAAERKPDRQFRDWPDLVPDEMRVFILQMVYLSSRHPSDKRWDGDPPGSFCEDVPHQPGIGGDAAKSEIADSPPNEHKPANSKGSLEEVEDQDVTKSGEPTQRPNMSRLVTSMSASRFRQIAAAWRVFDFCEPRRRSERSKRLKQLQDVLDAMLDGRSVKVLPARLAVGGRVVRCRVPRIKRRPRISRRVDITFLMDSKRYIYDVTIYEHGKRRRRFHTIHPNVVNRIKSRLRPSKETNILRVWDGINIARQQIAKRVNRSLKIPTRGESERVPMLPDHMIRFFFMDGLSVSAAEHCADNDIFCMAPIPPDDPRWSEFSEVDEDMPHVTADSGRLICRPYGRRQKMNFFHIRDSSRPRHQLICSAFHQLNGIDGRRAQREVERTQQALRKAVKQVTGRLKHGSSRHGLRYYHRLFLRALSACIQNAIIAKAVSRAGKKSKKNPTSSAGARASPFASDAALAAHCDAEFDKFLSELMDWLETTPRAKGKPQTPTLSSAQMPTVSQAAGMRSETIVHVASQAVNVLKKLMETQHVGERKQKNGPIIIPFEDCDLF